MVDIIAASGTVFLRDINVVQEAVRAGTNYDARHQRLYRQWSDFCSTLLVNTNLQDPCIPHIERLQVYSHRIRHAKFCKSWMDLLGK